MTPEGCRSAADVDALAEALFHAPDLGAREGVVHVLALADEGEARLRNVRIGPASPKSAHDFFALNLARARADAIVVSGAVLRAEPALRYALAGPAGEALGRWRRERAERREPPRLVVLTSGRGLDPGHPALHGWARAVVFTGEGAALPPLEGVEVVRHAAPSPAAAVAWAKGEGARVVSLEAGPSVTGPLHEAGVVDEVMLSVFHGALVDEARGEPAFAWADFERLGTSSEPARVEEPSGPWSFRLYPARR